MEFIYGTAILVVAIALLGFARYAVAHWERSRLVTRFAATEAMAMIITTLSAFGLAFLFAGLSADKSGYGMIETGAALGVVLLAFIASIRLTRRHAPAASAAVTTAPAGPRPATI